jgi:hypothetical protein
MQDVVLEVLEHAVRGNRSVQILGMMVQEQVAPRCGVRGSQVSQRIDRKPVMRGSASGREHHRTQQRHRALSPQV